MSLYKSMGLGFPLLIWDSLLTNSHEKRKAVLTGRFLGYTETISDW